ncbi:MAG: HAMP domain-containing protein [Deltaproteobacteria bacterium]|nr:HAMP domain-containing protein [Deltaproteobacteria bacterium]
MCAAARVRHHQLEPAASATLPAPDTGRAHDRPRAAGIRTKVVGVISITIAGTLGVNLAVTSAAQSEQVELDAQQHFDFVAATLKTGLLDHMLRREEVQHVLKSFARHNPYGRAELLTPDALITASSDTTRIGTSATFKKGTLGSIPLIFREEINGKETITRVEPLEYTGQCAFCHTPTEGRVGYLAVSLGQESTAAMRAALRSKLITSTVLSLFILIGTVWLALSQLVVRPLAVVARVMRRAEAGDLLARMPTDRADDEIGQLARGFNAMIERLADAKHRIEEIYHRNLVAADRLASVGELASGLAHEIKNPLAGISGALQIIAGDYADDPERREIVIEIQQQLVRLERTTQELLGFAKPKPPQLKPTQLTTIVERVLSLVGRYRAAAQVEIETHLESTATILGDPGQLEQVLLNLCLNGVQAIDGAGRLTVSTRDTAGWLELTVADTGSGILPEHRDRVFAPFFTTKTTGTGLGLSNSARIITEHHGEISFECPPQGGTSFTIRLPRSPADLKPHGPA